MCWSDCFLETDSTHSAVTKPLDVEDVVLVAVHQVAATRDGGDRDKILGAERNETGQLLVNRFTPVASPRARHGSLVALGHRDLHGTT